MFVGDRMTIIKEVEENQVKDGMIEKLDEMLTSYNVPHFFTLPPCVPGEDYAEDDAVMCIYYEEKDSVTFSLVYLLWNKTVRGIADERIKKNMRKAAER